MDKPLIPALRGALPGQHSFFYPLPTGFEPGDSLHLLAAVAGHPAGSVLPVLGQCLSRETPELPAYALVAYVPVSASERLSYGERPAAHFEVGQHSERWFAGVQLYFAQIDITDHAESLALERTAVAPAVTPAYKGARTLYLFTWPGEDQQQNVA